MLVRQLMNTNVVYLYPEDTVSNAARMLMRHDIGALPVCTKDGRLRGMVTDRDIVLRCVASDTPPEETKLREIMTRGIITVSPNDTLHEASKIMADEQIRRLPVVEGDKLIGMLSLADMAKRRSFDAEVSAALSEISVKRKAPYISGCIKPG